MSAIIETVISPDNFPSFGEEKKDFFGEMKFIELGTDFI